MVYIIKCENDERRFSELYRPEDLPLLTALAQAYICGGGRNGLSQRLGNQFGRVHLLVYPIDIRREEGAQIGQYFTGVVLTLKRSSIALVLPANPDIQEPIALAKGAVGETDISNIVSKMALAVKRPRVRYRK